MSSEGVPPKRPSEVNKELVDAVKRARERRAAETERAASHLAPETLRFEATYLPGAGFIKVWREEDSVEYESAITGAQPERLSFTPEADEWENFWSKCSDLGVWDWYEYKRPMAMDGTRWLLELAHGEKAMRTSGLNAYPPHGEGPRPSADFEAFRSLLSRLVGGKPI